MQAFRIDSFKQDLRLRWRQPLPRLTQAGEHRDHLVLNTMVPLHIFSIKITDHHKNRCFGTGGVDAEKDRSRARTLSVAAIQPESDHSALLLFVPFRGTREPSQT